MVFVLLALIPGTSAADCPDLTGEYLCPAYGERQPASPLRVARESLPEGTTEYVYTFANLHPPGRPNEALVSKAVYSPAGEETAEGRIFRCEGDRLSIYESRVAREIQQHYREERTGDYVVAYVARDGSGSPREVQRCSAL